MLTFVSYSRQNEDFVLRLVKDLRGRNVPIWLDQLDILTGEGWDTAIEEALKTSSHFLLVLSEASSKSKNVRDELDFAIDKGKIVIPILIDECDPPLRVRRLQRINFQSDYGDALERLLSILPRDRTSALASDQSDISGQWIREKDNCILFIKQKADVVVGIFDGGEKYKFGVYYGWVEKGEFRYKWKRFNKPFFSGSGELTVSPDQKSLVGTWWLSDEDKSMGNHHKFSYLSDVIPSWLNEKDFDEYKGFLNGTESVI